MLLPMTKATTLFLKKKIRSKYYCPYVMQRPAKLLWTDFSPAYSMLIFMPFSTCCMSNMC